MQKIKKMSLVLMIICLFTGCGKMKGYNVYERVYLTYKNMESFTAEVEVTSYSNNSENKYTLTQYYKSPDKQRSEYSSEIGGSNVTVINGGKGKLVSGETNAEIELDSAALKEKNYLMLSTFFENYFSSEETAVLTSGNEKKGNIRLSAETGSSNPYRKKIELLIDSKTLKPLKMTVYDDKNKPSLCIEYIKFEINKNTDENIFSV